MQRQIIYAAASAKQEDNPATCFHCPLKFSCALWLWDIWNVNLPICECTDERLVALNDAFAVDRALLAAYKKNEKAKEYHVRPIPRKGRRFGIRR